MTKYDYGFYVGIVIAVALWIWAAFQNIWVWLALTISYIVAVACFAYNVAKKMKKLYDSVSVLVEQTTEA